MFFALKPPFAPAYSHPGNNPLTSRLSGGKSAGSQGEVRGMGLRVDSGIFGGMRESGKRQKAVDYRRKQPSEAREKR
jgi:hypothetical protein